MNSISPAQLLSKQLVETLDHYFNTLGSMEASNLHSMVIEQVEKPLIEYVLNKTSGNQSKTAELLGINRNTLRKKILHYKIEIK